MDNPNYKRYLQATPQQSEALSAITLMVELARTVVLEHAALPQLHPALEQEAIARNSANALALLVLRINKDPQGLAGIDTQ